MFIAFGHDHFTLLHKISVFLSFIITKKNSSNATKFKQIVKVFKVIFLLKVLIVVNISFVTEV